MENKVLFVAGTFDDNGGHFSKIADKIRSNIIVDAYINGGSFEMLTAAVSIVEQFDVIYWIPNVPNDKPKLVEGIKAKNRHCILITSKRNSEGQYNMADIIQHALKVHANLFIEFAHDFNQYWGRVMDPLGNEYISTDNFDYLGIVLNRRVTELRQFTRIGSKLLGKGEDIKIPKEDKFIEVVREAAEKFNQLLPQPSATERFIGNSSFRCRWGFPSFRREKIFVSQRNVNKTEITRDSFLPVEPSTMDGQVCFYRGSKPSVDTPIHLKIYEYFPKVKYILHGHVYVRGAQVTSRIIPCGAIEEFDEICRMLPDRRSVNIVINLKGHGFVALADNTNYLSSLKMKYDARPMPETVSQK